MKKLGLLCLAIVMALGTMGIGYAMWFDTLNITGTVNTGRVSWSFVSVAVLDHLGPGNPPVYFPTTNPDYTCAPVGFVPGSQGYFWPSDKNVGWGEATIGGTGNDTITLNFYNTYPCYFNMVSFYVRNDGTIPIKVWKVEVLDNNGNVIKTFYSSNQSNYAALDLNNVDNLNAPDVEIQYGDNFGAQIEPGPFFGEFSFWVHLLQPAPQNETLTFSLKLTAVQWNEYQAGPIP